MSYSVLYACDSQTYEVDLLFHFSVQLSVLLILTSLECSLYSLSWFFCSCCYCLFFFNLILTLLAVHGDEGVVVIVVTIHLNLLTSLNLNDEYP